MPGTSVVFLLSMFLHTAEGGARPAVGYRDGAPALLRVVDLDPWGRTQAEVATAQAFTRMAEAARRQGVRLAVVSGFRTMEQQEELYRLYRRGRGHLASKPGQSNHQSGLALDLDMSLTGARAWMKRNAGRFGFRRTVRSEGWHWEYREAWVQEHPKRERAPNT